MLGVLRTAVVWLWINPRAFRAVEQRAAKGIGATLVVLGRLWPIDRFGLPTTQCQMPRPRE